MALIELSTLRDFWKNISDWVMGTSSSAPKVTIKSPTLYSADTIVINSIIDTPITPSFTAQKVVFLINDGDNVVVSFDSSTSTVGKTMVLKDGEGIDDVNLIFSVMNARLSVTGGTSVLRYMIVG